jgi:predicted MFS family arabinose efflux permease
LQKKLFNATYLLLILVNLITSFGYSMVASLISPYAVTLGAGLTLAGTMTGIFSIAALLIRPFSGRAMDVLNKRNMCIFSTVLICLSFLGYTFAPNIPVMLFFRVLHGMAFGISSTANMVLVSECVPKERLGEGLGYFGMGQIIAQICGPNIGIAVKDRFGYHNLFFVISIFTILAVALLFFIKTKTAESKKSEEVRQKIRVGSLISKECIVYALVGGLFSLGNGIVSSFLILFGDQRGIHNIALFFSLNAAVLFIMRVIIGKFVDKASLSLIVNISLVLTAVSMFFIGASFGIVMILIAAVLKAVGQGGGQIALQTACIKKVDVAKVGIATSTYFIGADIGQGFGPIIGGKISAVFSYQIMYYCAAVLMLVGIVLFNVYQARSKKKDSKLQVDNSI